MLRKSRKGPSKERLCKKTLMISCKNFRLTRRKKRKYYRRRRKARKKHPLYFSNR